MCPRPSQTRSEERNHVYPERRYKHSRADKDPGIGVPREGCKPTKPDDCGDGKQAKWNDDHKGRDDYSKSGDKDDYSKLSGKDDYSKHGKDDYSKDGNGDYSKHDGGWKDAKNDDCQPQKDYCDPKPPDDFGKGDTYRTRVKRWPSSTSHIVISASSHGPDHSVTCRARSLRCRPTMRSNTPSARWARRITST